MLSTGAGDVRKPTAFDVGIGVGLKFIRVRYFIGGSLTAAYGDIMSVALGLARLRPSELANLLASTQLRELREGPTVRGRVVA